MLKDLGIVGMVKIMLGCNYGDGYVKLWDGGSSTGRIMVNGEDSEGS